MQYTIKCDQMTEWDYDACLCCKHFTMNVSPRNWRCRLNNENAAERREFWGIWANEYLRAHGMNLSEDDIAIEYIGKRKRK